MQPLQNADVLSRVLALLGMEHWPAAAQVCHGWHSASVAKALEFRILQPEPLLPGVPVGGVMWGWRCEGRGAMGRYRLGRRCEGKAA